MLILCSFECKYFVNGYRCDKHYYYLSYNEYSFDCPIYIWPWSAIKIKVMVVHIGNANILQIVTHRAISIEYEVIFVLSIWHIDMTSYLMTIVMFALYLTIYEIFANHIKWQKFDLENEVRDKVGKRLKLRHSIEIVILALFHTFIYSATYIYTKVKTHIYAHKRTYIYTLQAHKLMYIHTFNLTPTHTYTYTHTHTHTRARARTFIHSDDSDADYRKNLQSRFS